MVDTSKAKHLVWDSMRAHISKEVKAKGVVRDVNMCVIPGGVTSYLQAGDIDIYMSFKIYSAADFADNWTEWHVARYDVYGEQFRAKWETSGESEQVVDDFNLDELHDALDDVALIDE
ncbi:hypothetical protein C6341_g2145 [Phytophthora cactorum]|nr:hypothetical protein C6341_g2145 [Phytophthora cactorum]